VELDITIPKIAEFEGIYLPFNNRDTGRTGTARATTDATRTTATWEVSRLTGKICR
jgi:hypothetical protein